MEKAKIITNIVSFIIFSFAIDLMSFSGLIRFIINDADGGASALLELVRSMMVILLVTTALVAIAFFPAKFIHAWFGFRQGRKRSSVFFNNFLLWSIAGCLISKVFGVLLGIFDSSIYETLSSALVMLVVTLIASLIVSALIATPVYQINYDDSHLENVSSMVDLPASAGPDLQRDDCAGENS